MKNLAKFYTKCGMPLDCDNCPADGATTHRNLIGDPSYYCQILSKDVDNKICTEYDWNRFVLECV